MKKIKKLAVVLIIGYLSISILLNISDSGFAKDKQLNVHNLSDIDLYVYSGDAIVGKITPKDSSIFINNYSINDNMRILNADGAQVFEYGYFLEQMYLQSVQHAIVQNNTTVKTDFTINRKYRFVPFFFVKKERKEVIDITVYNVPKIH